MIELRAQSAATAAALLGLVAIGLVSGCKCGTEVVVSIEITAPTNGSAFTLADDVDSAVDGVQIPVGAIVTGLALGEAVSARIDGVVAATTTVPSDGVLSFDAVTVPSGSHSLTVTAREGAITSEAVAISVDSACFAASFVSPEPGVDRVVLGAADDTDGAPCMGSFETEVVVGTTAPDRSEARILVNGMPQRTTTVMSGVARFEGVGFNLGAAGNTVAVVVTSPDGISCPEPTRFPVPIVIDCEGPACALTAPTSETPYLNQSDDVSDAEGFQGDFEVTTDAAGAVQPVRLVIDGDETGALSATASGVVASFGNVSLSEGVHRLRGECRDDAGNVSRTAPVEWTIDITACGVTLESPVEDQLFVDADDLDPGTDGVQIEAAGTAGSDCTGLRVASCSGIDAATFSGSVLTWGARVTLGSTPTQQICAETQDEAGNVSRASVGVRLSTQAPQLEIASPSDGTSYNIAGDATHTADLMSGNMTCEAAFEVFCTGVGDDVSIVRTSGTMATLGTAPCVADASAPAPYSGRASFPMLRLPSIQDGAAFPVAATQTVDRLTGTSAPISVRSDCVAPSLLVSRPMCGAVLRPATQDENPAMGFQFRTVVQNASRANPVSLLIQTPGGTPVYMASDSTGGTTLNFVDADYGSGGTLQIAATARDNAGNLGTSPACEVTVADVPTVEITTPTMDQVLGTDPCGAGTKVRVRGTTDAPGGSAVEVVVGGLTTSATTTAAAMGSTFDVCADAADGRSVTIVVSVTDVRGTGRGMVVVLIDTMPPSSAIDDLEVAAVPDRRGGIVTLRWTGVEDAGGEALDQYLLRCSATPITSEAEWGAAPEVALTTMPSTGMPVLSEDVEGFRVGMARHCMLRGVDPTGALTPFVSSVPVTLDFLTHMVQPRPTDPPLTGLGVHMAAVGDINADGFDDVVVGADNGAAVFLGSSAGGFPSQPHVKIIGPSFGFEVIYRVAGLGDFNGDSLPDFALAARRTDGTRAAGNVYVFFGRATGSPWPEICTIDSLTGCREDVEFAGTNILFGLNLFGADIAPAGDFDGDGVMDLVVGDPGAGGGVGAAYVLLGRSSYTSGSRFEVPGLVASQPSGFIVTPPAGTDFFGWSVGTAGGTVIGGPRHDILVSNVGSSTSAVFAAAGQAYSGSGLVSAGAGSVVLIQSAATLPNLGAGVGPAGDIDGDGNLDVVASSLVSGARGDLRRYRGTGSGFSAPIAITSGGTSGDQFAASFGLARHPSPFIGGSGDIDRDGRADTFVGSVVEQASGGGAAFLFYNDPPIVAETRNGAEVIFFEGSGDGQRVAGFVGDVNGDGFNDLAIGEPDAGTSGRFIILY